MFEVVTLTLAKFKATLMTSCFLVASSFSNLAIHYKKVVKLENKLFTYKNIVQMHSWRSSIKIQLVDCSEIWEACFLDLILRSMFISTCCFLWLGFSLCLGIVLVFTRHFEPKDSIIELFLRIFKFLLYW